MSIFGVSRDAQAENRHLEVNFGASVDVEHIFYGVRQALGSHQHSIWKEGQEFCDMNAVILGPQVAEDFFRKSDVATFLEVV